MIRISSFNSSAHYYKALVIKTPQNLRINHPCPFVPTKMNKSGDGFYCSSCNKTVIDFREKTTEEIVAMVNENTCGIFYKEQLPGQQQMSNPRRILFYFLAALSFIGFTAKSLFAQSNSKKPAKNDTATLKSKNSENKNSSTNEDKSLTRKERKNIRKYNKKITGCPRF